MQLNAQPFERHHHDRVVVAVTGKPGQGVDEDVLDGPVSLDTGDHLLERRPLVDGLPALARVDVFIDQCDAQFPGALLGRYPLGR
nr:hypothetical protein [Parafrankia sp. BMG5.11]